MRGKLRYYIVIFVTILFVIGAEIIIPAPIDWTETYKGNEKKPFGTYVLKNTIDELLNIDILENRKSHYQLYTNYGYSTDACTFIITNHLSPSKADYDKMLEYVEAGNQMFIAANSFGNLIDTLGVETSFFDVQFSDLKKDTTVFHLFNPEIGNSEGYIFQKEFFNHYFSVPDSVEAILLGGIDSETPDYIQIPFGKGSFLLNLHPKAFTNYNILYSSGEYAYHALTYIDVDIIFWDEYYKPGAVHKDSQLQFFFSHKSLKFGYFIALYGLLIFIILRAKRTQRIIPIIEPLKNTTIEFASTIGRLYLRKKNNNDMLLKRFVFMNEFIASHFYINLKNAGEKEMQKLASRTTVPYAKFEKLKNEWKQVDAAKQFTDEQLIQAAKLIDEIYEQIRKAHF